MSSNVDSKTSLCKIIRVGSSFFVWNAEDAIDLRYRHRIVGALVGTAPKTTHQNNQLVLPLKLMPEEVYFLVSRNLAKVVQCKTTLVLPQDDQHRKAYEQWKRLEIDRQSLDIHRESIEQRLSHAKDVAIGRKMKRLCDADEDESAEDKRSKKMAKRRKMEDFSPAVSSEEIAAVEEEIRQTSVKRLNENELRKEVWTSSPWFANEEQFEDATTSDFIPQTGREKLRYAVCEELWRKGYFLTSGFKFSGDFLAYTGDPYLYHAYYIVVCVPDGSTISSTDVAAWCRMGSQVKKVVLLCSWDDNEKSKVSYKALKWQRFEK